MAKNKNKEPKKKVKAPLTPEQKQARKDQGKADRIAQTLGPGYQAGVDMAGQLFAPGSMGRVDEQRPQETMDLIAQQKALSNFYGPAGQGRSADVQDYLARQKAGLEGYNAPEMTAMREQAAREGQQAYQTASSQLARQQARSGVRGASASAQLSNLAASKQRGDMQLSQDMMIKNADEKNRRLNQYGQAVQGAETDEFGRGQTAMNAYAGSIDTAQKNELERQRANMDQQAAERTGYADTIYGMSDLANQNQAGKTNRRYTNTLTTIARNNARRGRSMPDYAGYANAITNS